MQTFENGFQSASFWKLYRYSLWKKNEYTKAQIRENTVIMHMCIMCLVYKYGCSSVSS